MYDIKRLGANIRYLRKAHGETQEELGFALCNLGKNGDFDNFDKLDICFEGYLEAEEDRNAKVTEIF